MSIAIKEIKCLYLQNLFFILSQYIEWSRNSEYILCANIKKTIVQVYSIRYPEWKYKLTEGSAGLESVTWSPDSKYILTLSEFNVSSKFARY